MMGKQKSCQYTYRPPQPLTLFSLELTMMYGSGDVDGLPLWYVQGK